LPSTAVPTCGRHNGVSVPSASSFHSRVAPERVETLEHVGVLHAGPEVGADQVDVPERTTRA